MSCGYKPYFNNIPETSDSQILLTRRAAHMRTFPNVWVPPGGSIDWNEDSLFAAGLRELEEETNLKFSDEDVVSCKPLCMWESMYPTMLSKGIFAIILKFLYRGNSL